MNLARYPAPPRSPWRRDFPPVVAHANLRDLVEHPSYRLAKHGESNQAALHIVYDLIFDHSISMIERMAPDANTRIVGVHAEESVGRNRIPYAYAEVLAEILGIYTDPGVVQSSVANHGNAPSIYHRLVSQPSFDGYVEPDASYLIVDDTCTAGGTLANLKGFIEHHGGIVVGMSVLALPSRNRQVDISLAETTLKRLQYRHSGLAEFWKQEFGHELNVLTEGEAGHLRAAPSVDTIRNRLIEARRDLNIGGDEEADSGTSTPTEICDEAPDDR